MKFEIEKIDPRVNRSGKKWELVYRNERGERIAKLFDHFEDLIFYLRTKARK